MNEIKEAFGGKSPIVEVQATVLDVNMIRLKYFGLPGDQGPDLFMDESLARTTIKELTKCLPENQVRPKIVCLCGSTRFFEDYMKQQYAETLKGNIVLSVGCFGKADPLWLADTYGVMSINLSDKQKTAVDQLHLRKIDMADEVFIINPGGYVGDSTVAEIIYARAKGKEIKSMEPLLS